MFKLNQTNAYFWPVSVKLPTDGGKFEEHTFDAQFKRISRTDLAQMDKDVQANLVTDPDVVRRVLVGWKGITSDAAEVPFSQTTLDQILDIPGVAGSIVIAFFDSISGIERKN